MLRQRDLIKGIANISVVIMIAFFAMGMGTLGEERPTKIPETKDNFSATVIDQFDFSSDLTLFSFEEQTFLWGRHGGATVSIFFNKTQEIDFYKRSGDLFAIVTMGKGPQVELRMDDDRIFYGQLPYGLFSIKSEDVKRVIMKGLTGQGR